MNISDFNYELPDEKIAKFPVSKRDGSRLLVWRGGREGGGGRERGGGREGGGGQISETIFRDIASELPAGSLLVFNNTRVVRARLVMFKPAPADGSACGARVEIMCLEPSSPADHERAFAARGECEWSVMIGGAKKWKSGPVEIRDQRGEVLLRAWRVQNYEIRKTKDESLARQSHLPEPRQGFSENTVRFEWFGEFTFGELLEKLGRVPIPPYLNRDTQEIDNQRYQTVYAQVDGSVAAPTAGLHFTPELIERLEQQGIETQRVTLHVGAGTFLPVKVENALEHPMHTERFEVSLATLEHLLAKIDTIIAVGTTSVRTLESLAVLGWRLRNYELRITNYEFSNTVEQFEWREIPDDFTGEEALKSLINYLKINKLSKITAATRIMIAPGFRFRIVRGIITNFHQPKSTLLLLVSAFVDGGNEMLAPKTAVGIPTWRTIYDYALAGDFRFLSYGDSSLLLR